MVRLLTDEFDVDADTARADAAKWLDDMRAQDFLA
ncbi:MAG: PqqD family peptide modification chaperone [Bacteroidales bacterium]|nr:PqqD family peptide modification chaperone [Bacteroidales bacterium]